MTRFYTALLAIAFLLTPQSLLAETRAVASSADPRASEAGAEILAKGGSAADAAMAMMLALTVVEPQSSGIGGGGFLVHQSGGEDGALSTVNGREIAPAAAKPDRFIGADGKPLGFLDAFQGGHSVGVPGNVRLMAITHAKWGKLPWADLFAPAIRLAEGGFIVNKTMESRLARLSRLWPRFAEARRIYWRDGKPLTAGMRVANPDLAKTLKQIAAKGPDAFYTGEIARGIVDTVRNAPVNPADMTMTDLAAYKATEQAAVCAPYRAYVVCGMGPPSSGATTVLQILGTLAAFDMKALGKDNAQSWHLIAEAMQLAYADRQKYLGDDRFVDVPVAGMLSPEYLKKRSALVDPAKSRSDYPAGKPPGALARTAAASSEVAGTTHFTAVDKDGNVANMTSTIEGAFGSQLISGGFFLNNELTDFTFAPEKDGAPVANSVAAGKRPLSSMSPTLVFDADGKAIMALGSAGGKRIIMHVAKTLIGVIDFDLSLGKAIALPNIYYRRGKVLVERDTALSAMADELAKFGAEVQPANIGSKINGAQLTSQGWRGATDPRSEGVAIMLDENGKETGRVGAAAKEAPDASVF